MKCLGVFLKEPQPGQVKTRLVADGLSQEFVLQLYNAFLNDTFDLIQTIPTDKKFAFIAPGASSSFQQQIREKGFELFVQQGADLGERMAHFFQTAFEQGGDQVVLIGTDSPSLPVSLLKEAFVALNDSEVVLGPTQDGGYYLIGMSSFVPEVFQKIPWSSEKVLEETLAQLEASGRLESAHLLPMWYDIDHKKDLQLLAYHLKTLSGSKTSFFPSLTWSVLREGILTSV